MKQRIYKFVLKTLKYCGIALVGTVGFVVVLFIFFNLMIDWELYELEKKVINDYKDPIAIGEVWEEDPFRFVIESVQEVPMEDVMEQIEYKIYSDEDKKYQMACLVKFSFSPKGDDENLRGTCSFYPGVNGANNDYLGPLPLPASTMDDLSFEDHLYIMLIPEGAETVHMTINVPYGENDEKYRKIYMWNVDEIQSLDLIE